MPYHPVTATSYAASEEFLRKTAHPSVSDAEIRAYVRSMNAISVRTKEEWEQSQRFMRDIYFAMTGLDWE